MHIIIFVLFQLHVALLTTFIATAFVIGVPDAILLFSVSLSSPHTVPALFRRVYKRSFDAPQVETDSPISSGSDEESDEELPEDGVPLISLLNQSRADELD